MRYLIVNGDDLGLSPGVNRGILEAHQRGILTSASLMVDMPATEGAASLARSARDLSVGLHVRLEEEPRWLAMGAADSNVLAAELDRQLRRFRSLLGREPTHMDSHHHVHRQPAVLSVFLQVASHHGLPLREHSPARHVSGFYGRWGDRAHPEQIDVEALARLLREEIGDGVHELVCHPGYADPDLRSSYTTEREIELKTLCDPAIREVLSTCGIHLVRFLDLPALAAAGLA